MRSSTSALLKIVAPKVSFRAWPRGCPLLSVMKRRDTIHFQASSERESRHSVGQLSTSSQHKYDTPWKEC